MKDKLWDVVISGAGPAGLAAGIFCARTGLRTLVCEKGMRPSPFPRGETVHPDKILDDLLGDHWLEDNSLYQTSLRKFNSPGVQQWFEIQRKTPSLIFHWDTFIDRLWQRATDVGVEFAFNKEVVSPLFKGTICHGIQCKDGSKLFGRTILVCDGHTSRLGQSQGVPYQKMNSPMVKCLLSNFQSEYSGFEYFFIAAGEIDRSPHFPPAIAYIFPRGSDVCEAGLMVFNSAAMILHPRCIIPDEKEMLKTWQYIKATYPRLSDLLKDTKVELEEVTALPHTKIQSTENSIPGLIFLGDSIGFIEASGASGILSSMKSAQLTAEFLIQHSPLTWTPSLDVRFTTFFQKSPVYKRLKTLNFIVITVLNFIFARIRTGQKINRHWWLVKLFYKLG